MRWTALSDELASILAGFIPRLTSEEYEQTLQVVTAGIIGAVPLAGQERIEVTDTDKSALLHTAGILLQNGPDGKCNHHGQHCLGNVY